MLSVRDVEDWWKSASNTIFVAVATYFEVTVGTPESVGPTLLFLLMKVLEYSMDYGDTRMAYLISKQDVFRNKANVLEFCLL